MRTFSKKAKERLFLIFLIGGFVGYLDTQVFDLAYLVGSGLGMIIITVPFGILVYTLFHYKGKGKEEQSTSEVLDQDLSDQKEEAVSVDIWFQRLKYSLYLTLFFVVISFMNLL